jgi:hypothetical protein
MKRKRICGFSGAIWRLCAWAGVALALAQAFAAGPKTCRKLELLGEVQAGREWKAPIGQGWVFRVLPIQPPHGPRGEAYSGWDLVVDREQPAGFPDALLLATPPYSSINEREIGTTFGLRAQDAIGWNPRSFRFLTSPQALAEGQHFFQSVGQTSSGAIAPAELAKALEQLMALSRESASGQFRVLDAKLVPGVGDAAPFAQNWALAAARTPHAYEAAVNGKSTAQGELRWMRFSIDLWLPLDWKTPRDLVTKAANCPE